MRNKQTIYRGIAKEAIQRALLVWGLSYTLHIELDTLFIHIFAK